MNRKEKEQVIDFLRDAFAKSQASFLVNYKGLSVSQVSDLRSQLRAKNGTFKVAKVTLVRRVADEIPAIEGIKPFLQDQVGLIFAEGESPAVAKVLYDFAQKNERLSIIAGCMDDAVLSKDSIKILATLPSREVLYAQVAGTMKAPITKLTVVLNMLLLRLALVLKEIEKKKAQS